VFEDMFKKIQGKNDEVEDLVKFVQ
jgi:hypothetical protein